MSRAESVQSGTRSQESSNNERRFGFGRNWRLFVARVSEEQVARAEESLRGMLGIKDLAGRTFLDVSCGSGLFSLAAARLGAERIHSFDFDPESVESAGALKARFLPGGIPGRSNRGPFPAQTIFLASAFGDLSTPGVSCTIGAMWTAIQNVQAVVRPGCRLFVAIYNDQGLRSRVWLRIKRFYNHGPVARVLVLAAALPSFVAGGAARDLLHGRNPVRRYAAQRREMTPLRDWVDWLGGYPFEFARPEDVLGHFRDRGFVLERQQTVGGKLGCNEFVFRR